jgi:hypothetical protein
MWVGEWQNQYGSVLRVTDESDGRIAGTFRTALGDSGFAGEEVPVDGIHRGDCVHFAFSVSGPTGDAICSFTGLLRDGRMETVWQVVSDTAVKSPEPGREPALIKLPWAHAVLTNSDTFNRQS